MAMGDRRTDGPFSREGFLQGARSLDVAPQAGFPLAGRLAMSVRERWWDVS